MDDPFTAYTWGEGVEIAIEPRSSNVREGKDRVTELIDTLETCDSLPAECRVTDADYAVEFFLIPDGVSIQHFNVYSEGVGVGRHLIDEIERLAVAFNRSTVTVWIGNTDGGSEQFLDSLGFTYTTEFDPAHGETLIGERKTGD